MSYVGRRRKARWHDPARDAAARAGHRIRGWLRGLLDLGYGGVADLLRGDQP